MLSSSKQPSIVFRNNCSSCRSPPGFGGVHLNATGVPLVFHLHKFCSQVFQELAPNALEIIKPDILPTIRSYVAGQINDTLQHLSMRSIISALLDRNEIVQLIIP